MERKYPGIVQTVPQHITPKHTREMLSSPLCVMPLLTPFSCYTGHSTHKPFLFLHHHTTLYYHPQHSTIEHQHETYTKPQLVHYKKIHYNQCSTLHYIIYLQCTMLYCITRHYTMVLQCTKLHYIAVNLTSIHYYSTLHHGIE